MGRGGEGVTRRAGEYSLYCRVPSINNLRKIDAYLVVSWEFGSN
jgi:hypothetical protein